MPPLHCSRKPTRRVRMRPPFGRDARLQGSRFGVRWLDTTFYEGACPLGSRERRRAAWSTHEAAVFSRHIGFAARTFHLTRKRCQATALPKGRIRVSRQRCNGGILPPPRGQAMAARSLRTRFDEIVPPLFDANALAAEARCLRYIARLQRQRRKAVVYGVGEGG